MLYKGLKINFFFFILFFVFKLFLGKGLISKFHQVARLIFYNMNKPRHKNTRVAEEIKQISSTPTTQKFYSSTSKKQETRSWNLLLPSGSTSPPKTFILTLNVQLS